MNSVQLSGFLFLPFETQLKEIVCEMVKMSDATCFYVWGIPNRNHQRIRSNIKLNEINFFIMWQSPFCRRNYPQNGKMSSYRHNLAFACEKYHKKTPAKLIIFYVNDLSLFSSSDKHLREIICKMDYCPAEDATCFII